ncbi:hypothetical protein Dda_5402 [Drechslerella dactyloides]|uniref:Uncharacterized protein n=1 Tax=Drechslerella dactyloides TaxID=74499 RepID=A0AAD6NIU1_DREDA|nr:hypothetical protein Dda_5402 [Drechslerella dactyloides]
MLTDIVPMVNFDPPPTPALRVRRAKRVKRSSVKLEVEDSQSEGDHDHGFKETNLTVPWSIETNLTVPWNTETNLTVPWNTVTTAPAASTSTPRDSLTAIEKAQEKGSGYLLLENIDASVRADILKTICERFDSRDIKVGYDSVRKEISMSLPDYLREAGSVWMLTAVNWLSSHGHGRMLEPSPRCNMSGAYAGSIKEADWQIRPRNSKFPTVVVEMGTSKPYNQLLRDKDLWLQGTKGVCSAVVLVNLKVEKDSIMGFVELWRKDGSKSYHDIFPSSTAEEEKATVKEEEKEEEKEVDLVEALKNIFTPTPEPEDTKMTDGDKATHETEDDTPTVKDGESTVEGNRATPPDDPYLLASEIFGHAANLPVNMDPNTRLVLPLAELRDRIMASVTNGSSL